MLQPLELFAQGGLDHVLQLLGREGEVHAVRVHLHQLEVASGYIAVQEVVVELQHGHLGQLVDHDTALEEALDGDCLRALFHPVDSFCNFVAPVEEWGTHVGVQLVLLAAVERVGLLLLVLDQLTVGAVAKQLEDVGKDGLAWVRISPATVGCDLVDKPAEDGCFLVIDGSIDRLEGQAFVDVPVQQGRVQQDLLCQHHPQQLALVGNDSSATIAQVLLHVAWDGCLWDCAVNEKGWEVLKLGPLLFGDFDVHLCKTKPLLGLDSHWQGLRCFYRVRVCHHLPRAPWHLVLHCAWVERVGVVAQDLLHRLAVWETVAANGCLAHYVLAGEDQAGAAYYCTLQHLVSLQVWWVQRRGGGVVQALAHQVLQRDSGKRDSVLEDVYAKVRIEVSHVGGG